MKILHATLKGKWFDMIASEEKKEEYRELKEYWGKRLINLPTEAHPDNIYDLMKQLSSLKLYPSAETCLKAFDAEFKHFDIIRFRNGYSKNARTMDIEFKGIDVGFGHTAWGATLADHYFIISLGKIISKNF
jgi:hypothetical protein